eukprot:204073_1
MNYTTFDDNSDDHEKYTGSYKWHIDDATLINKILSAKCGSCFESDEIFHVGELNWKINLYPNGLSEKSKGCCGVGAILVGRRSFPFYLSFPSSWKSIFCQIHIECPQMQSKMVFSHLYNKPYCWTHYISSFEDLKASRGTQLSFVITIHIARVTLKENNKILYQMPTNKCKIKTQLQWKIDEEMMKKLKSFDKGKGICSD